MFTVEELRALADAAGDTAELEVYDTDQTLSGQPFADVLDWLTQRLGLDPDRVDACFADVADLVEPHPAL